MSNKTKDNPALHAGKPSSYLVIVVDTLAGPELKPGVAGWPSSWFDYIVKASNEEEAARLAVEHQNGSCGVAVIPFLFFVPFVFDYQLQRILNLMV